MAWLLKLRNILSSGLMWTTQLHPLKHKYVDDEISAIKKYLESGLEQDDLDSELGDEAAAHKKRKAEVLRIKADEGHAEAKAGQSSKGPNETDKVASAEADTQSKSGVMETITDQQTANSKPSGVSQIQAKEADVLALAELTRALDKKEEKEALEDHHKGQKKRFNATTAILQRAVKDVTRRGGGGRGPRGGRWH